MASPTNSQLSTHDRLSGTHKLLEVCDRTRAWHIAAVSGEIDVRNSDDLFRARILAAVHAKESDNISRRVRRKQQELAEHGRPHGGPRRYGYRVDLTAIEPDEATNIQELARRTLAGESLASLCRELNGRGIPTAAGGRWSPATLRRILIGPHLAGLRVYGEQLYPAAWPAILSEDTHHALRALLTDPQRTTNPTHPTRHLWSGFLICGHCGMRMYAYYRPAKTRPVKTLRCHRKLGGCGRLARSAEPIETFLEAAVFEIVRHPAFAQYLTAAAPFPTNAASYSNRFELSRLYSERILWPMPLRSRETGGATKPSTS